MSRSIAGNVSPRTKIIIATSGGKDATLALHQIHHHPAYQHFEPVGLMTTYHSEEKRTSSHALRSELMQAQATALGLPLHEVYLYDKRHLYYADYAQRVGEFYDLMRQQGVFHVMYGDIYLEDVKAYRDQLNEKHGMTGVYPLWKQARQEVLRDFFALGYRAVIVAVDSEKLSQDFLGKELSPGLLDTFPSQIDPCAEQGEYHSFCFAGPLFRETLYYKIGDYFSDGRNWYADLRLKTEFS